jgi:unsaturated chondroitin disaccharide hydrolase
MEDGLRLRRTTDVPGPTVELASGALRRTLPGGPVALSLDLRLGARATLTLGLGGRTIRFRRVDAETLAVTVGGRTSHLRARPGWRSRGWRHVTVTGGATPAMAVDGEVVEGLGRPGRSLVLRTDRGSSEVANLIASSQRDPRTLLLHRLAELDAQVRPGRFPVGVGNDGVLRFSNGWTRGFWPGSLWHASDLTRGSELFRRWALETTIEHFGREGADTHDLGFMYGSSSVAAHERLCRSGRRPRSCGRLRRSGLRAARSLLELAATNEAAGMLPTRSAEGTPCRGCTSPDEADTIVDSMMNLGIMLWAGREMREPRYRDVARRSADGVARHLVRPDGSTAQSVHVRRSDGSVIRIETHQGYSASSTWARGQGWAIYGFSEVGAGLRSQELLALAERAAAYVERRLPPGGVPPYDYDAPDGAPLDTSAGVITAAGLYRLGDACRPRASRCGDTRRWRDLADRMLAASLRSVVRRPPVGFLGSQVFSLGGTHTWDDEGEFMFGLHYALEAVRASLR